jgi:RNA polymerase sigma factor (sigma-70 family)
MHHPTLCDPASPALKCRLLDLWERTNDAGLRRVADGASPVDGSAIATEQDRSDWTSTCLMNAYKQSRDGEVLALLFELNRQPLLQAIRGWLRQSRAAIDANDVLQDVFLNVCRYPQHFLANRADAFRCWGHRIVRNTVFRHTKHQQRQPQPLDLDAERHEPIDQHSKSPELAMSEQESAGLVNNAYVLFLGLYLRHFDRLPPRSQRVLTLAEIDRLPYAEIGTEFGVQREHVKMLVFRSRQQIYRGMAGSLAALAAG